MRRPNIDDVVRLTQDVPDLDLIRGEIGIVRSTWFAPAMAFEVEFSRVGHDCQPRALLTESQVELQDQPQLVET